MIPADVWTDGYLTVLKIVIILAIVVAVALRGES